MKYLKKYKLFESNGDDEVINYLGFDPTLLDDYMVPFEDMDCNITLKLKGHLPKDNTYDDVYIDADTDYDDNSDEIILYEYGDGIRSWRKDCPIEIGDIEDIDNLEFFCFIENNWSEDTDEFVNEISELIDKLNDIFEYVNAETNDENYMTIWFKDYKKR